ncbi:hypothetical protein [Helicobacter sp.]|nr:hypothetical protein [Helicobacter sp.]
MVSRHCEKRSDEAIYNFNLAFEILAFINYGLPQPLPKASQ